MFLPLVVSLALVAGFQGLAALGAVAAVPGPRARGAALALGLTVVAVGLGARALVPWTLGAALCGLLARRRVARGDTLWRVVAYAVIPVWLASSLPLWSGGTEGVRAVLEEALQPPAAPPAAPDARLAWEQQQEIAASAVHWMLRVLPAALLVFSGVQVLPVVALSGLLEQRRGARSRVLPVTAWRTPTWTIWWVAAGLAGVALRVPALVTAGANLLLVSSAMLAIRGAAILWGRFASSVPLGLRLVLAVLLVLTAFPFLAPGAAVVGFIDSWLDVRRTRGQRGPAA